MNSEPTSKVLIPRMLEGRRERYIKLIRTQLQHKHIDGELYLRDLPEITDLSNVETVSGCLDLENSNVKSLGNLQSVGGDLYLGYSKITSLGNLKSVGGSLYIGYSKITSLGNLQKVGGTIWLSKNHKISEELIIEYRKKFKIY